MGKRKEASSVGMQVEKREIGKVGGRREKLEEWTIKQGETDMYGAVQECSNWAGQGQLEPGYV